MCTCIYIYMYIYIYARIYIYTREIDREKERDCIKLQRGSHGFPVDVLFNKARHRLSQLDHASFILLSCREIPGDAEMAGVWSNDSPIQHGVMSCLITRRYIYIYCVYMCFNRGEINLIQTHVARE